MNQPTFPEVANTHLCVDFRYDRDFDYDFFGFKTLERSYLLKLDGKVRSFFPSARVHPLFAPVSIAVCAQVVERPQHMLMRVALGVHLRDIDAAIETYHLMSERWFTHASPTMFNAGTPKPQMSSCFLLSMVRVDCPKPVELAPECAV